jgi:hypothetical protein
MTLEDLLVVTGTEWLFDPREFGALEGASSEEVHRFALNYVAKQLSNEALGIAAEADEPRGEAWEEVVKHAIERALVDVLRLFNLMGMSKDDLVVSVQRGVSEKPIS